MSSEPRPSALRDLRALFDAGAIAGLTDDQLLRRYAERRADAEAAFAALVARHGPMVWGTCRRALGGLHEAEDAFQATFLVLARRADAVRVDDSLGRWLHGVASKVAARARSDRARRLARERRAGAVGPTTSGPDPDRDEQLAALDEELARLPEKYRTPLVLCHLEGLSYAGAAERLGCPSAAIKGRLARGRELLRARLSRRGLAFPASTLGIVPDPRPAVPPPLARSAAQAASALGRPATVAGLSSLSVSLANGVTRTMILTRLAKLLALLIPAPALFGLWAQVQAPTPSPAPKPTPPARVARDPAPASTTIAVPLPAKDELHALLRRVAGEAIALDSKEPTTHTYNLSSIGKVQGLARDLDGARQTFAFAARRAGGELGSKPDSAGLWRIGHSQAEVGLRDEARATILRGVEACPGVVREINRDHQSLQNLVNSVEDLVKLGDQAEARQAADRLRAFATDFYARSETGNAREVVSADVAGALASVGDFEGAFLGAGKAFETDRIVGQAALKAVKCLGRDEARRFVDEAIARISAIERADLKYFGLADLAEAQALMGDFEGAKRSARLIGEGRTDDNLDMTDGQPYAMQRIAAVQRKAGQVEAARETLREAYRTIVDHPGMIDRSGRFYQIAMSQVTLGDLDGALLASESMSPGRRSETLALVARAQAITGRNEEARKMINRALVDARAEADLPPELPPAPKPGIRPLVAVAIVRLSEVQAMAGDIAGALKTLRLIDNEDDRRFALQKIVTARATAGDIRGAIDLALREPRTTSERYSAIQAVGRGVEERLWLEPR